MPGPTADSPNSWAKQQQDPKQGGPRAGAGAGAGGVTSTLGAPGGTQEEGSDMEDEGHSTGSRMPSGILKLLINIDHTWGLHAFGSWLDGPWQRAGLCLVAFTCFGTC